MNKKKTSSQAPDTEKMFLHDVASPLMIAMGLMDRWARKDPTLAQSEEFKIIQEQLGKLNVAVTRRREALVKRGSGGS